MAGLRLVGPPKTTRKKKKPRFEKGIVEKLEPEKFKRETERRAEKREKSPDFVGPPAPVRETDPSFVGPPTPEELKAEFVGPPEPLKPEFEAPGREASEILGNIALTAIPGGRALTAGRLAGAKNLGTITRTATIGKESLTTQRAFVGKGGQTIVDLLFKRVPKTAKQAISFGANKKTTGLTKKFLIIAGLSTAAASLAVTTIGTYPFASFLKEEALQQLSFAVNSAIKNDDIEGAKLALEMQRDFLSGESEILEKLPWTNVLAKAKDFFAAAKVKVEIDAQVVEDLEAKLAGETDDEIWERRRQEQLDLAEEKQQIFEDGQKRLREEELRNRGEDAAFWRKQQEERRKLDEQEREDTAKFWLEYRKTVVKLQSANTRSNLNFGLL